MKTLKLISGVTFNDGATLLGIHLVSRGHGLAHRAETDALNTEAENELLLIKQHTHPGTGVAAALGFMCSFSYFFFPFHCDYCNRAFKFNAYLCVKTQCRKI